MTPERTALVIRHVLFEDLGMLAPLLDERGYTVRHLDAGVDTVDPKEFAAADLGIVLGGPIGVGDASAYPVIADELEAVTGRLALDRPTLGICLGAQIMAAALGADVAAGPAKEIGYAPLSDIRGVLACLAGIPVLHWHGDTFTLPEGAMLLASTEAYPHQAFSVGRSLALQFHLEADPDRIEQWLIGHAVELADAGIDPSDIRAGARKYGPALREAGAQALASWLDATS